LDRRVAGRRLPQRDLSPRTTTFRWQKAVRVGRGRRKSLNTVGSQPVAHMLQCLLLSAKENAMNKTLIAAAAALIPLAGIAADGQKQPATPAGQSGSFDTLDSNKDGRISMPEASADPKLVEGFSSADKNGDGYLDNSEFDNRTRPKQ
jgi:EF hand